MNIAMEQTEEYVDGQLKARYGDCFIRGNNGTNYFILSYCCYMQVYLYLLSHVVCSLIHKYVESKEVRQCRVSC